jgi:hypothetical protein
MKNEIKDNLIRFLIMGGTLSGVVYLIFYRNGSVTAGPYLAILIFSVCCIISTIVFIYAYVLPAIRRMTRIKKIISSGVLFFTASLILYFGFTPFINLSTKTYYLLSGEDRVDAYLAEFKFEEARKANIAGSDGERAENLKKITIAEAKFFAAEGKYDRALKIVDETWGMDEYHWDEKDWGVFRLSLIEDGIDKLCSEKGDFVKARLLALKAPDDLNVDGVKIGNIIRGWRDTKGNLYTHENECEEKSGKPCLENRAKGPSMREVLLKKIAQFEELLKK